jgi:hypothetical protein
MKERLAVAAARARSVYLPGSKPVQASGISRAIVALFANDAFWMTMEVKTLGMLLSTSSEFRNEILLVAAPSTKKSEKQDRDAKIKHSLESILHLILKHRAVFEQEISVREAMRRFALTLPNIICFFAEQPTASPYYRSMAQKHHRILFISAFKLAAERKGGLQKIAQLKDRAAAVRDRTTERMVGAAAKGLERANRNLTEMMDGINRAIAALRSEENREKFMGRITILKSVRDNIVRAQTTADWLQYVLETPQLNKDRVVIRKAAKSLEHHEGALIRRYNSHHRSGHYDKIVIS